MLYNRNTEKILYIILSILVICPLYGCTRQRNETDFEDMIMIPGGKYIITENMNGAIEKKNIETAPFYIDRKPVSCGDFKKFQDETGFIPFKKSIYNDTSLSNSIPITDITFAEAESYARWAGKRLPTENELAVACFGGEGSLFPWGDKWDDSIFDPPSKDPHSTGLYPANVSPFGLLDPVGNIFQMTLDKARQETDGRTLRNFCIVRGGGWTWFPQWNRSDFRTLLDLERTSHLVGFRCVKPVDPHNDKNLKQAEEIIRDFNSFEIDEALRQLMEGSIQRTRHLPIEVELFLEQDKKGFVTADIGCGIGFLTYKLSRAVGEKGRVYAVDIDPQVLDFVEKIREKEGYDNIVTIKSERTDVKLPPASCDEIYILGTLHLLEFDSLKPFLASCKDALKTGGKLIIMEYRMYGDFEKAVELIKSMGFEMGEIKPVDEDPSVIFIKR